MTSYIRFSHGFINGMRRILNVSPTGMWVEKYRPSTLSEVVNQKDIVGSLVAMMKDPDEMPHLLFSGSAGVGKTTVALCIARQILGEHAKDYTLELNASDERGIDMVREKVKRFSRFAGMGDLPFKIIILDEADEMTSSAQTALRRIIEDTANICRFILIANNVSKIIGPIQSRCAAFKFTAVPKDEAVARLDEIASKEKINVGGGGLEAVYDRSGGDLRHSINLLQATASMGAVTEENVRASSGMARSSEVAGVLKDALAGRITEAREKMVELVKVYGMSESDFLKYLNAAVFQANPKHISDILGTVAKYDYRIISGANPEIQLSAMLAEIGAHTG